MLYRNNTKKADNKAADQVAERLAKIIIRWQQTIATKLNRQINQVSKRAQKRVFWIICLAWVVVIAISTLSNWHGSALSKSPNPYAPVHIGQSSEPHLRLGKDKTTDSLTIKK
ncbi:hypothetical protein [Mucilaginibacter aquariorum]|uniref:Uncharacterized protein n=1 Tax=Mucilaginibacter aquariorum TaxID=2967225 RepID=A0ABT1T1M6_9SPHI|nr:hypothetical protein [Mucilaginibacter aquariorum]MCQ6958310.1 hypothetical protein [Mucilaginibacter aquariorum]